MLKPKSLYINKLRPNKILVLACYSNVNMWVPHLKTKTFFMKRIILALALMFALGSTTRLAAQETRVRFYYYPSTNVYYNPTNAEYWYYDDVSATWTQVKTLPTTITLTKAPRYTVYYNGEDVWKDNTMHMQKYKVRKNGTMKAKKPKSE